jgi:hypothetical protein
VNQSEQDTLARSRFMLLSLLRAAGVALMLFGMGIMGSGLIPRSDVIGGAIFIVGMLESLIVPSICARKWRTPPGA